MSRLVSAVALTLFLGAGAAAAQPVPKTISNEADVPAYTLPAALVGEDGTFILTADAWPERRREILESFETEIYGRAPAALPDSGYEVVEEGPAWGGSAWRKQIRLRPAGPSGPTVDVLLYVPADTAPVSTFLGLNFAGNHTVVDDAVVMLATVWPRQGEGLDLVAAAAKEASRGSRARRWPVRTIVERGYGLATAYYGDIDPDFDDGFLNGVHPHFYDGSQERPAAGEWGSIAAWAWGLSRILDYLEEDASVDGGRVAVLGHSRLGKTALWAGARDERFAAVISNDSGCGGAALSRRRFGETVEAITTRFPHWFADNFDRYAGKEDELPVDQHLLLAAIAPRPLYVASASRDSWADPRGEFLALVSASPVYGLLGEDGLSSSTFPDPGGALLGTVSYHLRQGKHDLTEWDWEHYLEFADLVLGRP